MIQAIHTALNGLNAQQTNIDTIANNIANINTTGFKKSRVDFKDAMYQSFQTPVSGTVKIGDGVTVSETQIIGDNGIIASTQNPLDFALEKDGFFTLSDGNNELFYTRNGSFKVSAEQGQNYLVSAQGYYVLDTTGNKINLTENSSNITSDSQGRITVGANYAATLGIASFSNPQGLEKVGMTNFKETDASGQPIQATDISVRQGFSEGSNVDLADEMTRLIRAQKAFSFISKIITVSDEMEATSNNIRT